MKFNEAAGIKRQEELGWRERWEIDGGGSGVSGYLISWGSATSRGCIKIEPPAKLDVISHQAAASRDLDQRARLGEAHRVAKRCFRRHLLSLLREHLLCPGARWDSGEPACSHWLPFRQVRQLHKLPYKLYEKSLQMLTSLHLIAASGAKVFACVGVMLAWFTLVRLSKRPFIACVLCRQYGVGSSPTCMPNTY